jgi:uncharacterized protein YdeI (YjbR/CyaY-like superfamily)
MDSVKPTFFATPSDFRAWLAANHSKAKELLVGFYKASSGKPSITWPQSVDQALCFGWIDGVRRSLGTDSYTIRFTPRRARSVWSTINTRRFAELHKQGLVSELGQKAFGRREARRSGVYSFEQQEDPQLAPHAAKAFAANQKAWAFFQARPPWYQRAATWWVVSAKKEETRDKRLHTLVADSAAGRTIAPLTRPTSRRTAPVISNAKISNPKISNKKR